MNEVKNLNQKRVCDISDDAKKIVIKKGNCITIITASDNCPLRLYHQIIESN